jgi:hypothetical protein
MLVQVERRQALQAFLVVASQAMETIQVLEH